MKNNQHTKEEIIDIIKNMFVGNEIMFIYYCGSRAYGTCLENSDIDITAVFKDLKGIIHASTHDMDIFAYGYDSFLARQSMSDELPLYNLIHADDIINVDENLIYLNENYKDDFNNIKSINFYKVLPLYLDAFIRYYDHLINDEKVVVKRAYHILRLRAILDNVLETKKYDVKIDDKWKEKINKHKVDFRKLNNKNYLEELKSYLDEIKQIKEENFKELENEV